MDHLVHNTLHLFLLLLCKEHLFSWQVGLGPVKQPGKLGKLAIVSAASVLGRTLPALGQNV